ncbi:MAG: xylulokinase [Armatimonadetes bacterium]|nr:xylulokinase [Armatimonadota bacterium]
MAYLLGLDVGTTGTKTLLIDETGRVVARAVAEYPMVVPRPNWAEQNPEDWWRATVATIRQILDDSGVDPAAIRGVGLSGQMHGSVFLDAADKVIRPAILWCDQRTAAQCQWIHETVGFETVVAETLNPVLPGFQAGKIIWLRQNEPENYARVRRVLLPKDYVRLRLTGEYATEVSDASGTSLLNVPKRQWSGVMLDRLEIPIDWLPQVYESPEITGEISRSAAEETGLAVGTPVVGGGGDQAAGAVGNGIVETGVVSSTVGTSGVVFAYLDEPLMDEKLRTHTFCHAVPGKWHTMGVMLSAGGSLRWLRDALCSEEKAVAQRLGVDPYELIVEQAASVPPGAHDLIFLPYLTGERTPYPDPNARGVFFGLSLLHDKRHMIRAVLEGVGFGLRDSFEIIKAMGVTFSQVRASGGGARSRLWRQIQSDITGEAHWTINIDEGPAFGVALLAGVGTGVWPSVPDACRATIRLAEVTEPSPENHALYTKLYAIYQSLYAHVKPDFDAVAEIA